jgi:cell division protein FtsI/penicillin-binding protein 2
MRTVVLLVVAGVIAVGVIGGGAPDSSAEPTVQSFLLAWEQGDYLTAARLTTGSPHAVADALRTAYDQLDAAALYLTMGTIDQQGDVATARFGASVDLGEDGAPWNYQGRFTLRWTTAGWRVEWSPSVINPGLRPGMRLAVRTTLAPRALVLDASGQPLQQSSVTYAVGVRPDALAHPAATANALGRVTGLDATQVLPQILAAPQTSFLDLLTLDAASYARMSSKLLAIPGLIVRQVKLRLFDSIASDVVGTVGTENALTFRQYGVAYQPGDTTGLSGLQLYYQHRLVGTPTTEVIAEDANGSRVTVLDKWSGTAGQPVRTTLDSSAQLAADNALAESGKAGAIVAMQASTGKILAVASSPSQAAGGPAQPNPLTGLYPPGQAFTIVSTAALLDTGLSVDAPVPCTTANDVGGETFTNDPPSRGLGQAPLFSVDFASGCGTAFAGLSLRLHPGSLTSAASWFGLGSAWRLPLTALPLSMPAADNDAQLAAETIGSGNVQVSPLDMALIAAQVDSGLQLTPSLVTSPADDADPPAAARDTLTGQVMSTLRGLMRGPVKSGAARQANLSGLPVYGQAGQVPLAKDGKNVWASWFVGFRGNVAFAVLELDTSMHGSAVPMAARFLRHLPSSLLGQ